MQLQHADTSVGHTQAPLHVPAMNERIPGGGGEDMVDAEFGVVKVWYEILNTLEKCGTKCPDCAHPANWTKDFQG